MRRIGVAIDLAAGFQPRAVPVDSSSRRGEVPRKRSGSMKVSNRIGCLVDPLPIRATRVDPMNALRYE